jgi:cold shock CspA family protein
MSQHYSDRMLSANLAASASQAKNTGTITHWNAAKGWGFIRRDDGRADLFCHINQVIEDIEELKPGQRVLFEPGTNSRNGKAEARDVRLIEA